MSADKILIYLMFLLVLCLDFYPEERKYSGAVQEGKPFRFLGDIENIGQHILT